MTLRVLSTTLALSLAVLAGCGQGPRPKAASGVPFGFADGLYDGREAQLAALAAQQAGASVVRVLVRWANVEKVEGQLKWTKPDAEIDALAAQGIKVLPVITTSPYWAQDPADGCPDRMCPPARAMVGRYAAFVATLVQRYKGKLAGVEVWNEPNATFEWHAKSGPDPARFAQILRATAARVHGVPLVLGGLAGYHDDTTQGGWAAERYLKGVYAAGGKGSFDAIGIHPYARAKHGRPRTGDMDKSLNGVRKARDAAHDTPTPLWVTEVGLATGMPARNGIPAAPGDVTPKQQGLALLEEYDHMAPQRDIKLVLFFRIRDDANGPTERGFGVLNANWQPKPAFCVLAKRFAHPAPKGCV